MVTKNKKLNPFIDPEALNTILLSVDMLLDTKTAEKIIAVSDTREIQLIITETEYTFKFTKNGFIYTTGLPAPATLRQIEKGLDKLHIDISKFFPKFYNMRIKKSDKVFSKCTFYTELFINGNLIPEDYLVNSKDVQAINEAFDIIEKYRIALEKAGVLKD